MVAERPQDTGGGRPQASRGRVGERGQAAPPTATRSSPQLRERSAQEFTLPEGTVYPALHRLEEAGLLRSDWADQAGRRRRLYELTAKGVSALVDLQGEWRRFSSGVQAVIGGTG